MLGLQPIELINAVYPYNLKHEGECCDQNSPGDAAAAKAYFPNEARSETNVKCFWMVLLDIYIFMNMM